MVYLWRAVDAEGEVLDVLVQTRRNKRAALKLMRKLLSNLIRLWAINEARDAPSPRSVIIAHAPGEAAKAVDGTKIRWG